EHVRRYPLRPGRGDGGRPRHGAIRRHRRPLRAVSALARHGARHRGPGHRQSRGRDPLRLHDVPMARPTARRPASHQGRRPHRGGRHRGAHEPRRPPARPRRLGVHARGHRRRDRGTVNGGRGRRPGSGDGAAGVAVDRRRFIGIALGLGVGGPLAARALQLAGVARAEEPPSAFVPKRRGGGGPLRLLYWQAPTILNPHLAVGVKDATASRIFYEPLADFDADGNLVPVLAAELPTAQNGGIARDGTWVTWQIKKGASWHDGRPLTADDVVFTWEYAADPAT